MANVYEVSINLSEDQIEELDGIQEHLATQFNKTVGLSYDETPEGGKLSVHVSSFLNSGERNQIANLVSGYVVRMSKSDREKLIAEMDSLIIEQAVDRLVSRGEITQDKGNLIKQNPPSSIRGRR